MNRYRDWLAQAERDLCRAEIDLKYQYWEWACFTAQQAAEKALKALLMKRGVEAWGHALTPMLTRLDDSEAGEALKAHAQLLDAYYIPTRYPNGFAEGKPADYYNESTAREAFNAARTIIEFCHLHLA